MKRVVFSSTCATYGVPTAVPIPESHAQWPINPYGWSKLFVERLLESFDRAHGLRFVALRYFNAAGATARCGRAPRARDAPRPARAARGRRARAGAQGLRLATTTRPTARRSATTSTSATSAEAHLLALAHLRRGGDSQLLNLGTGTGYSVLEVIEAVKRVTGRDVPFESAERREGDPPRLVADASRARAVLGLTPKQPSLDAIVRSAWDWMQAHPDGYGR